MTSNWIVWMLSITVLLLLFKAVALMSKPLRLMIAGRRVDGTVIGLTENTSVIKNFQKDTCQSPTFEFYTENGIKITVAGKFNCVAPTARLGDVVKLAYHKAKPTEAKIFSWSELPFSQAGIPLASALAVIYFWINFILISNNNSFDDPLHVFSDLIIHFNLNATRFPMLFILFFLSLGCFLYSYILTKAAFKLHSNGIRVTGKAISLEDSDEFLNYYNKLRPWFIYISFPTESDLHLIMRRSLIKPLTQLKPGDTVDVIHPRRQPHKCVVNCWDELYLNPAIFALLSVGFFIMFYWVLTTNVI